MCNASAAVASVCPTCCRAAGAPFRRFDASGRVSEGCVDGFHTGALVPLSGSAAWHNRPAAKAIRARLAAFRSPDLRRSAR